MDIEQLQPAQFCFLEMQSRIKLRNRSALKWLLDQYNENKHKDPTIAEKFNTYRFADYKEKMIDLLKRVTTVSVGTIVVVKQLD